MALARGYGRAYYERMDTDSPKRIAAYTLVLNVEKVRELSRVHEINSDTELAKTIGVDQATLYRVMTGRVAPSNAFMAKLKAAFPSVPLDALFSVQTPLGLIA